MNAILIALYFISAPPSELLALNPLVPVTAQSNKLLRWFASGQTIRGLATLTAPAKIVADYQDEGFLRITIEPNTADNGLFYGPDVNQVFVNGRKLNCRVEGQNRRAFYPILNNREPCER